MSRQQSPNNFYSILQRREFGLICISSESCLGSIVGLPGSCACYPTFRSIGQGRKGITTAIVLPVHLAQHLSRESRKLTVMMWRELVNHSMTYRNLQRFLRVTRRTSFQSNMYTHRMNKPHTYQGLCHRPTIKLLWLSESVNALQSGCLVRRIDTSFMDQDVGSREIRCFFEHPCTSYKGAQADDWKLFRLY